MRYSPQPPYELLSNRDLDFPTMQRLRRFARYWDLVANSGNFTGTTPLLWRGMELSRGESRGARVSSPALASPFAAFLAFSDWLYARLGRRHGIALVSLAEAVFEYLVTEQGAEPATVATSLRADFERAGRRERPPFMQDFSPAQSRDAAPPRPASGAKRQARHLPGSGRAQARKDDGGQPAGILRTP